MGNFTKMYTHQSAVVYIYECSHLGGSDVLEIFRYVCGRCHVKSHMTGSPQVKNGA